MINKYQLLLSLGFMLVNVFIKSHENLIEDIHVTKNRIDVFINKDFKARYLNSDFFVEYEDPDVDLTKLGFSIVTVPMYMNIISLIWASGKKYHIDEMDKNLYFSLKKIKEIFKRLYPSTRWNGELIPHALIDNTNTFFVKKKNDAHIALLFSHGLDSVCTSMRHIDKKQMLITAWGHSDCPLNDKDLWRKLKNMIIDFGQRFNHENVFIKSNYHDFINFKYLNKAITPEITLWRIEAIEGLGWLGLAAPLLLSKGYKKFYIASSYCWDNPYPQAALPFIDHNIKFADIAVIHDGFDLTRAQKNEYLARECKKQNINYLFMRVCVKNFKSGKNCCKCEKCLRTITGFLILGEDLSKYGFKLTYEEAFKSIKDLFIRLRTQKLVDRISYYWRELQDLARKYFPESHTVRHDFLQWFIEQDINSITKIRPVKLINWKDFTDFYSEIPLKFLQQ